MEISAHMLVKNEENFVWYAINSVIDYVDELLIWDTGSIDKTVEIIKTINNPKIKFKEIGEVNPKQLSEARQKMLEETNADWIFVHDADEVWHDNVIKSITSTLKSLNNKDLIITPNRMLIGDIYHYLEDKAGQYKFYDKKGHYNIRLIRNVEGLNVSGVYPKEYYATKDGNPIQNTSRDKAFFDNNYYLHASFLPRSSKDRKKIKYEVGIEFPLDYYYPEVFFKSRPAIVPSPWKNMSKEYKLKSLWQTPLKKIKRIFV